MSETAIYYNTFDELNTFVRNTNCSKIFVMVDENTKKFCLPILLKHINFEIIKIEIQAGENNKNIKTTQQIWQQLTDIGADRSSLLLNLGGGVITDIGGFATATFKRGMRFINIPTTALGMVDAAIGGKTGIDFNGLKNQIGLFTEPEMIVVFPKFLKTLPQRELLSGLAEIIKYGLIDSSEIWKSIEGLEGNVNNIENHIIEKSITIKEKIVLQDPKEKGIRKTLNFGHTLGHAIETYFLTKSKEKQLLHGEAIAIGMILASHLSYQTLDLSMNVVDVISKNILKFYTKNIPSSISKKDYQPILKLLKHDKKNVNGVVNFILLKAIGTPVLDCQVNESKILKAFEYYNTF